MLASSMMLTSISEESPTNVGFRSRLVCQENSNDSLSGWGNSQSRQSYRTDLSSMGGAIYVMQAQVQQLPSSVEGGQHTWGFFVRA